MKIEGPKTRACRHRLALVVVFLAAFLLRMGVWSAYLGRPEAFIQPDTPSYLVPGNQLFVDGTFPSFSRTPVYPVFLAVLSRTLSSGPGGVALVQILISLGTIAALVQLARRAFGFHVALFTAAFMALDVTAALSANSILTETLFTFLLVGCLAGLLHVRNQARRRAVTVSLVGIGFSLLTLCRPIAFLLFVVIAFWLFAALRKKTGTLRASALVLCFCVFSALLPGLWMIRNHAHTGKYFLSTIGSIDLYEYRAAWNVARIRHRSFAETQREFRENVERQREAGLSEAELAEWQKAEGIRILKERPLLTLLQGVEGFARMYLGISGAGIDRLAAVEGEYALEKTDSMILRRLRALLGGEGPLWVAAIKMWSILHLLLVYAGVGLSLVWVFKGGFDATQRGVLILMLVVIGYFTFLSVGAEAYSRLRVPVAPALCVLAATGWWMLLQRLQAKRKVSSAAA